jgi:hypothetical protein
LADPFDLPFDEALLDDDGLVDEAKVAAAVDALLVARPHLATRRPSGDVGQGAADGAGSFSLVDSLRASGT